MSVQTAPQGTVTYDTFGAFQQTGSGTAAPLGDHSSKIVKVKAHPDNSGILYIGGVGVTTATGYPLSAGEESLPIQVNQTSSIYIIGTSQVACVFFEN